MTPPLLHVCARATTFSGLAEKLADGCAKVTDWDTLLAQAESQGLGPLLHWHLQPLEIGCPGHFRRAARLLYLRHHHTNTTYTQVLHEVLDLLSQAGIEVLVLKGAALCHTIYPEIGLRPMRDIDLLLRKEQAQQAQDLLIGRGFSTSNAPRPIDHFHLPSLHKTVGGLPVCLEIHHGLFPDCPPYYRKQDFDRLRERAIPFNLFDTSALTLSHEDMLWHIFQHGFHMPLTYEPFKLIAVADMVTFIEQKLEEIDWQRMKRDYPEVLAALPLFHHLTPWQEKVMTKFSWKIVPVPADVGKVFQGWPRFHLAEQQEKGLLTILGDTFLPPEWWCRLYYGIEGRWTWYRCRWLTHPRHVFWWIRIYSAFLDGKVSDQAGTVATTDNLIIAKLRQLRDRAMALYRKLR